VTGNTKLGNTSYGIFLNGANNNTIGGTASGARNVISGNGTGIYFNGGGSANDLVKGNYIGTNAGGNTALGNTSYGIYISGGANKITVGGSTSGSGNVISANGIGIYLDGAANSDQIQGNFIGTDSTGSTALAGTSFGIYLSAGSGNTIGGTTAASANVLSGNTTGVYLASGATGTLVQGNDIGTDVTGSVKIGNTSYGIYLNGSGGNTIGGTAAGAGNVISGNGTGVFLNGAGATNNLLQGNYIGTNSSGAALGNSLVGVSLSSASNNTIGGTAGGAGNTIAYNTSNGVKVNAGSGDAILADAIFSNASLGISLLNAGNNSEPAPSLSTAAYSSGTLSVSGTVAVTAANGTTLTVEIFSNNSNATGQGQTYLGSLTATVSNNVASFSGTFVTGLTATGKYLTATTTDSSGNTSQFSSPLIVS
jgi:titin